MNEEIGSLKLRTLPGIIRNVSNDIVQLLAALQEGLVRRHFIRHLEKFNQQFTFDRVCFDRVSDLRLLFRFWTDPDVVALKSLLESTEGIRVNQVRNHLIHPESINIHLLRMDMDG